jgi:hypothetical protein
MNWILVNKLKSSNVETCLQAGKKLAAQPMDAVQKDVRKMLESRSAETRLGAVYIALALSSVHARKIISTLLQDSSPRVRIETLRVLRQQDQTLYASEAASCLNDADEEVIEEAIDAILDLLKDAAASYLANLLTHSSKQIRFKTFFGAKEFWKYEHLDRLKECLKKADITYSEEVDKVIRGIETRTQLLSQAIAQGGSGATGVVAQPRFKAASSRGQQQPVIIQQVAPQQSPYGDFIDDNTEIDNVDGFTGVIKEVTIQDLIQLACINRKTQAFKIKTRDGFGEIFVRDGEIIHATFGGQEGQDALFSLLSFSKGQFKEMKYSEPPEQTITAPWEFLLMEAARIHDESTGNPGDMESI